MRDREGIYAAGTTQSVTEMGADGEGNASDSSAGGPPHATPGSLLDVQPDNGNLRPSNPESALPEREPHQPAKPQSTA
jgi:hypothetical protein